MHEAHTYYLRIKKNHLLIHTHVNIREETMMINKKKLQ
jgi:hypothetical protein